MGALSIIDPPVSAYSRPQEIEAWIEELKAMGSGRVDKASLRGIYANASVGTGRVGD